VRSVRRARRPLVALVALVLALAVGYGVKALNADDDGPAHPLPGSASTSPSAASSSVALSALPAQVAATVRLVERGGPFPYPHNDGVVFHNNERHLPREPDGYYREYTVPTPGSTDRGARRLIIGKPGEYWYTGDHYETFQRVDVNR
jgi:guanyl-specific ribonuclease Sa